MNDYNLKKGNGGRGGISLPFSLPYFMGLIEYHFNWLYMDCKQIRYIVYYSSNATKGRRTKICNVLESSQYIYLRSDIILDFFG